MEELTILLVSDIHKDIDKLKNVEEVLKKNHLNKIDYVLCMGDVVNIKTPEEYESKEVQKEAFEEVLTIGKALQKFAKTVYMIPGNHDPDEMFLPKEVDGIHFIHKEIISLKDNLILAGFGGSIPSHYETPSNIKGERAWEGYPFKTALDFEKEWILFEKKILDTIKEDEKKQIVLMTHNGPNECDTTVFQKYDIESPIIMSGSSNVKDSLAKIEFQNHLLCNIHGHTHAFKPMTSRIGICPIVNPGSLMEGNFAVLRLEKLNSNRFDLTGVNLFRFLPSQQVDLMKKRKNKEDEEEENTKKLKM
ncbi:hypothetical protein ABK040_010104 [Willaertia magna]